MHVPALEETQNGREIKVHFLEESEVIQPQVYFL